MRGIQHREFERVFCQALNKWMIINSITSSELDRESDAELVAELPWNFEIAR
jgi:hypothetical protein